MLANVFEKFRSIYLETYELSPAHSLNAPGLEWLSTLKRPTLTNIDMLLMVEEGIGGGICHTIYAEANNKYIKKYDKNKESSYF